MKDGVKHMMEHPEKASKCALNNSGVAVQGIQFEAVQIGKAKKNVLQS